MFTQKDPLKLKIHGDNILECEKTLKLIRDSLDATILFKDSPINNPTYLLKDAKNKNLFLALRNVPRAKAIDSDRLSAYDVLGHKWLVLTQRALESLMERI